MNRRIWRRAYDWNTSGWNWNTTAVLDRVFLHDGWNELMVLNRLTSNAHIRSQSWGLDLSGLNGNNHGGTGVSPVGLHGAGGIGGLLSECFENAAPTRDYLYCYDANGNVGQLLASANPSGVSLGDAATTHEYDPYGNKPAATDPGSSGNMYHYSSKFAAAEFSDYGNRWLHSRLGRWLSRDPAGEMAGLGLYGYCLNSPLDSHDPLGLHPMDCGPNCVLHGGDSTPRFTRGVGCCGPDITGALFKTLARLEAKFQSLPTLKAKLATCESLYTPRGWDVTELLQAASSEGNGNFSNKKCGTGGCGGTAQVFGSCYSTADINYILLGRTEKLCKQTIMRHAVGLVFRGPIRDKQAYYILDDGSTVEYSRYRQGCDRIYAYYYGVRPVLGRGDNNTIGEGSGPCRCGWYNMGWEIDPSHVKGCDEPGCSPCGTKLHNGFGGHVGDMEF